jgi:hypothetical protein
VRTIVLEIVCLGVLSFAVTLRAGEFHVAKTGDDSNPGTQAAPLLRIQRAAELAQPGDMITVHEGVYRERVNPPRGGESYARRIVYQAAPGAKVEIRGSEVARNWSRVQNDTWKTTVPNAVFGDFNPYGDVIHGDWFDAKGRQHHTGAVYLDGQWLIEAVTLDEVLAPAGGRPAWLPRGGGSLLNVAWLRPVSGEGEGAGAGNKLPATQFSARQGTRNAPCSEGGECLGFIEDGHWVRYEGVELGTRCDELEIRAASEGTGGVIEIHRDAPDGTLLGSCTVCNTGGWQSWSTFRAKLEPCSCKQTLCLVFRGHEPDALKAGLWIARVERESTTIWAQFPGADPNRRLVEFNARKTVFYPDQPGRNYITVRGFSLRHAATQWAPPTAEQIGLIGPHWSKGWIIENNTISHSVCAGVSLGKYGDRWDNTSADTAEGYVKTIERALENGWNKETVGHHVVRHNDISHCEQAGVVGSLGAAFSTVEDNTIHDIHVRRLFGGAEMAGIKLHGAIDVQIRHNQISRACLGLWLDWMAQGTRVTSNLFHSNGMDLFVEVDHGPFLVDNNIFLSPATLLSHSQGGAFAHNLLTGTLHINAYDARLTPFHKPHATTVAGLHDNPNGDDRYFNNILVGPGDLSQYDRARLAVRMDGNVFLKGAKPSVREANPVVLSTFDPAIRLVETPNGIDLEQIVPAELIAGRTRSLVTTGLLDKAAIPRAAYEAPDGTPISLDVDHLGNPRNVSNPTPGPFELPSAGHRVIQVR